MTVEEAMRQKAGAFATLRNANTLMPEDIAPDKTVVNVEISRLDDFRNHPYRVIDDDEMDRTVESIQENGIIVPLLLRPAQMPGRYEIVAGHRRRHAAERAGLTEVPALIREMDDDTATILMVDSNRQRTDILPSEKAQAYRMKMDAIKRKGGRVQEDSALIGQRSIDVLSNESKDSRTAIQRYIRLTNLIPELMTQVDEGKLAIRSAVDISYLSETLQNAIFEGMKTGGTIDTTTAEVLKKRSDTLTADEIVTIMAKKEPQKRAVRYVPNAQTVKSLLEETKHDAKDIDRAFKNKDVSCKIDEAILKVLTEYFEKHPDQNVDE